MSEEIIFAVDAGNVNGVVCFAMGRDPKKGSLGRNVFPLTPASHPEGIPAYAGTSEEWRQEHRDHPLAIGIDAVRNEIPPENRVNRLKSHIGGETFTIDGNVYSYEDAYTMQIQDLVRKANQRAEESYGISDTVRIYLTYPAAWTDARRTLARKLAEKGTLADGKTHIQVKGTIAEPGAAALDYLFEHPGSEESRKIQVFDLGGGTLDLAVVTCYPKGRARGDGRIYYEIEKLGGDPKLGGCDFDEALFNLVLSKAGTVNDVQKKRIRRQIEPAKRDLSDQTATTIHIDDDLTGSRSVRITREEFEKASASLLKRSMDLTAAMAKECKPDLIIATGGSSRMPMVMNGLNRIPGYQGKVVLHRPENAVAFGAARFGAEEAARDPKASTANGISRTSPVMQRVQHSLGAKIYDNNIPEIFEMLKAGDETPKTSEWFDFALMYDNQTAAHFEVFEARGDQPDKRKIDQDYRAIVDGVMDLGRKCRRNKRIRARMIANQLGEISLEGEDPERKNVRLTIQKNLNDVSE